MEKQRASIRTFALAFIVFGLSNGASPATATQIVETWVSREGETAAKLGGDFDVEIVIPGGGNAAWSSDRYMGNPNQGQLDLSGWTIRIDYEAPRDR